MAWIISKGLCHFQNDLYSCFGHDLALIKANIAAMFFFARKKHETREILFSCQ
jgi:hypothetical protein